MSRYVLIKDGVVCNAIEADANFVSTIETHWDVVIQHETSGIGWTYANGIFAPPPEPNITSSANSD